MRSIIVGFGRIADTIRHDPLISKTFTHPSHAQVLSEHPAFEWCGVVDPSIEARDRAVKSWGVVADSHVDEAAKEFDPEFAVLCTPPETRLNIIKQIPTLKWVLIEKPLGKEGDELMDYCDEHGIEVTVNFWRRGVKQFQNLNVDSVGRVQAAFAIYGNGLYNNGSHLVDFLQMLFGEVRNVTPLMVAPTVSQGCGGKLSDVDATFSLEFDGFNCSVHPIDFSYYREVMVDIWGTHGRLVIGQESLYSLRYPVMTHRSMSGTDYKQNEIALDKPVVEKVLISKAQWNLYDAISKGQNPSPGRSALKTQKILDYIAT